jgi:hypothetical protein
VHLDANVRSSEAPCQFGHEFVHPVISPHGGSANPTDVPSGAGRQRPRPDFSQLRRESVTTSEANWKGNNLTDRPPLSLGRPCRLSVGSWPVAGAKACRRAVWAEGRKR